MERGFVLKADLRDILGSSESRRIRKYGKIPAVVCMNGSDNLNIEISSNDFEKRYSSGDVYKSLVDLKLGDKSILAFTNKIDLHPVTDAVSHVDFIEVKEGKKIKVKVSILFTGVDSSIGIKRGGYLNITKRKVELFCDPNLIPSKIEFDISSLIVGSKIKSYDLNLPEGSSFVNKKEFDVASITGRGSKSTEEDVVETGGEDGESEAEDKDNSDSN